MTGWIRGFHGEPPIDPPEPDGPDEYPEIECPDCEQTGREDGDQDSCNFCAECHAVGWREMTHEEWEDDQQAAAEEAAERRADDY